MPSAPLFPQDIRGQTLPALPDLPALDTTKRPASAPPDIPALDELRTEYDSKGRRIRLFFPEPTDTPALFHNIQVVFRGPEDNVVEHFPRHNQEFDCQLQPSKEQFVLREVITPQEVAEASKADEKPANGLDETGSLTTSFPFTAANVLLRSLHTFEDGSLYLVFHIGPAFCIKPLQKQNGFFSSMRSRSPLKDRLTAEGKPYDTMHVLIPRQLIDPKWTSIVLLKVFRRLRNSDFHKLRQMYQQYARTWNWSGQKEGGTVERPPSNASVDIKCNYLERYRGVLHHFAKGGMKESWRQEVLRFGKSEQERIQEAGMPTRPESLAEIQAAMLQVELGI
ncbi:hypothetical protein KEM54_001669 [Ascosphaera aggregata]|nr:hypothetical protein KEM54_001669 [Ascosphaera aggregata]